MRRHIGPHLWRAALVLALLAFGFSVQHARAQTDASCSQERLARSAKTTQAVNTTFSNRGDEPYTVYWIDFDGKRQKWFDLAAGQTLRQSTFTGHIWLVAKPNGQCVAIFSAPGNFVVGKPPAPVNTSRAQQPPRQQPVKPPAATPPCPTVRVTGPSEDPMDGTPIVFTADVRGMDKDFAPTYNWTLSDGIIMSGQGTSSITVDTGGYGGRSITATVNLGGFRPECPSSANTLAFVRPKPQPPRKFDEFGTLKLGDLHSRLDNYVIQLQNEPMAKGYVITYGGRTSTPTAAKTAGEKVKKYMAEMRGIEYSRIVLVDGGYREKPFTEVWIVPEKDSTPPTATPTVKPPRNTSKKTSE